MKKINRKIKNALFILIISLIAFIGFSKAGILFSVKGMKVISVSTNKKTFDPNSYVASMISVVPETTTKAETTTKSTTTKVTTTQVTTEQNSDVKTVGAILNKSLGGVLAGTGEIFASLSMEKGMDPFLLAAISVHETGNGTSSAARNKFNFGGIMCSGGLCRYSSVQHGLESFVNVVYKNYYSKGLTTPEAMNSKYAASKTWASKINYWYDVLKNK